MKKRLFYQFIFALFSIFAVIIVNLFWQTPPLLILSLSILAYTKSLLAPIRHELLTFFAFAIFGPTMEGLMMLSEPWSYTHPHIFNFPIWLPFLWGLAGTLGITLYHSFSSK